MAAAYAEGLPMGEDQAGEGPRRPHFQWAHGRGRLETLALWEEDEGANQTTCPQGRSERWVRWVQKCLGCREWEQQCGGHC